jgi:hypothetical protein
MKATKLAEMPERTNEALCREREASNAREGTWGWILMHHYRELD